MSRAGRCSWALVGLGGAVGGLCGLHRLVHSRNHQLFGSVTGRVDVDRPLVALTLDDGPTEDDVEAVISALGGTPATFFLNGARMADLPDAARRLVAASAELGNHTSSHRNMLAVTPGAVAREVVPTDQLLREAGQQGEILFRPPYGRRLLVLPWWLWRHGRHTIMWDVDVETFDGSVQSADQIAEQTVARVRPGSIILLHPWDARLATQQAIPKIIRELRRRGYEFVTVSELLWRAGA